jgi:hypothetical protein
MRKCAQKGDEQKAKFVVRNSYLFTICSIYIRNNILNYLQINSYPLIKQFKIYYNYNYYLYDYDDYFSPPIFKLCMHGDEDDVMNDDDDDDHHQFHHYQVDFGVSHIISQRW